MPPVAVNPVPIRRRKRPAPKLNQGVGDTVGCDCAICRGRPWPSYYVGLWTYIPARNAPPKDWAVRRLSVECYMEGLEPTAVTGPAIPPATDGQAMNQGLSVRDPGRRSIWAPLMSGRCEACEGLRRASRRFCLACEALIVAECREHGWGEDTIRLLLAVPVNGHDLFADSYEVVRK